MNNTDARENGTTYVLGVDGGGTHTRVLLAASTGEILAEGHAGSTNRNHLSRDEVGRNMRTAVRDALGGLPAGASIAAIFLGMCGVSTANDRADLEDIVRAIPEIGPGPRLQVENDTLIGLTGGLSGRPGLVLIAGTGSACFGVNAAGTTRLCGGWGALLDDVGSGYWFGMSAMQAAVRAEDGRLPPTALRRLVYDTLGISDPRAMLDRVHNHDLCRTDIAKLAPGVMTAARNHDQVALDLLHRGAAGLSELVAVTARDLFASTPCELIFVGGLALSGAPFQTILTERIQRDTPRLVVRTPELRPVAGAILEALRLNGVSWTPAVISHIQRGSHR